MVEGEEYEYHQFDHGGPAVAVLEMLIPNGQL
jgi:hypothetical protein